MNIQDLDYDLPKELIAQTPSEKRDEARLLVVDRRSGSIEDRRFSDITDYIPNSDVLVLNDTRVFPARLLGKKKKTEGRADILLLEPYQRPVIAGEDEYMSLGEIEEWKSKIVWRCLLQPSMKEGQEIVFAGSDAQAIFLKRDADGIPLIEFLGCSDPKILARQIGLMPLPPYIKHEQGKDFDEKRYQTVYASKDGAVAAPTAGLHFTEELLKKIEAKGVIIARVTLHVGYGTFKPVENLATHRIHSEYFEMSPETAETLNHAKAAGRKVWAVGTTSTRTLETCVQNKQVIAGKGETDIFIQPPFEFEVVDHLITNFHLPRTTLLLLISAFMGETLRQKTYQHAIAQKYRFYSYGDAMLII